MKTFLIVLILLGALSCQGLSRFLSPPEQNLSSKLSSEDYQDHYESFIKDYLETEGVQLVSLSKDEMLYVDKLYQKILQENASLIRTRYPLHFYIVNSPKYFYFSLPRGHLFFSLGLFKKYFKSEDIFIASFTYEVLKSNQGIYSKHFVVPLGFVSTEKLLYLSKIVPEVKNELNKWAYLAMKRAGFNYMAYLQWLQLQNKNILDFAAQLGDSRNISREEFLFKNFIIKEGQSSYTKIDELNSSPQYYKLLIKLKKISHAEN